MPGTGPKARGDMTAAGLVPLFISSTADFVLIEAARERLFLETDIGDRGHRVVAVEMEAP